MTSAYGTGTTASVEVGFAPPPPSWSLVAPLSVLSTQSLINARNPSRSVRNSCSGPTSGRASDTARVRDRWRQVSQAPRATLDCTYDNAPTSQSQMRTFDHTRQCDFVGTFQPSATFSALRDISSSGATNRRRSRHIPSSRAAERGALTWPCYLTWPWSFAVPEHRTRTCRLGQLG